MPINIKHLLKVVVVWTTIMYCIWYLASVINFRMLNAGYSNVLSNIIMLFAYFLWGLILWNIIAVFSAWLFAFVFNKIK